MSSRSWPTCCSPWSRSVGSKGPGRGSSRPRLTRMAATNLIAAPKCPVHPSRSGPCGFSLDAVMGADTYNFSYPREHLPGGSYARPSRRREMAGPPVPGGPFGAGGRPGPCSAAVGGIGRTDRSVRYPAAQMQRRAQRHGPPNQPFTRAHLDLPPTAPHPEGWTLCWRAVTRFSCPCADDRPWAIPTVVYVRRSRVAAELSRPGSPGLVATPLRHTSLGVTRVPAECSTLRRTCGPGPRSRPASATKNPWVTWQVERNIRVEFPTDESTELIRLII